jgi:hypothetical protein
MNPERWQKIKRLCHSGLKLEPGRRESFLREACAGDESLLREVASLLSREGNLFEIPVLEAWTRVRRFCMRNRSQSARSRGESLRTLRN